MRVVKLNYYALSLASLRDPGGQYLVALMCFLGMLVGLFGEFVGGQMIRFVVTLTLKSWLKYTIPPKVLETSLTARHQLNPGICRILPPPRLPLNCPNSPTGAWTNSVLLSVPQVSTLRPGTPAKLVRAVHTRSPCRFHAG